MFIVIFVLIVVNCSKQVIVNPQNSKNLNYDFIILNANSIDKTMIAQKYGYTDGSKKYIAIVTYKPVITITNHLNNAEMKQYLIDKNGTLNLTIPKNSSFIISLPANRTIMYTWNIKNNIPMC